GWRYRRGRARDRIHVRDVQAVEERVHGRDDGQGSNLGRFGDSSGGDRLWRGLFRGRNAQDAQRRPQRQDRVGLGERKCGAVHGREVELVRRQTGHAFRFDWVHLRRRWDYTGETRFCNGAKKCPARPHIGIRRQVQGHSIYVGRSEARSQPALEYQSAMRLSWTREEVDARLYKIMKSIHAVCHRTAEKYGTPGNYVNGANIASFLKVANAMMDQGLV